MGNKKKKKMRRNKTKQSKTQEFNAKDYERPGLSVDEIEEIKEAFDIFDVDKSGAISVSELLKAMTTLGFDSKNPAIFNMINDMDNDGNGEIEFEEFLDMMTARISDKNTKEDLERVFKLFDEDRTGNISLDNLKKVARELGEDISEEELKEIILRADLDGDGLLTFDDFLEVIVKKTVV